MLGDVRRPGAATLGAHGLRCHGRPVGDLHLQPRRAEDSAGAGPGDVGISMENNMGFFDMGISWDISL